MHKFTKTLLGIAAATCIPTLNTEAQEAEKPINPDQLPSLPSAQEGDVQCLIITTFTPSKKDIYYLKIGKSYYIMPLVSEGITRGVPIRGSRTLVLYKKQIKEDEGEVFVPALQAVLKGTDKLYLVIFSKKKDNSLSAVTQSLSPTKFPGSAIYLFNQSSATLGVQINTTQKVVKPFTLLTYPFVNTDRDTYTSAKIVMRYKGENKIMASKRLRLIPGRRIILTCFPSRTRLQLGATGLRLLSFQDKP